MRRGRFSSAKRWPGGSTDGPVTKSRLPGRKGRSGFPWRACITTTIPAAARSSWIWQPWRPSFGPGPVNGAALYLKSGWDGDAVVESLRGPVFRGAASDSQQSPAQRRGVPDIRPDVSGHTGFAGHESADCHMRDYVDAVGARARAGDRIGVVSRGGREAQAGFRDVPGPGAGIRIAGSGAWDLWGASCWPGFWFSRSTGRISDGPYRFTGRGDLSFSRRRPSLARPCWQVSIRPCARAVRRPPSWAGTT